MPYAHDHNNEVILFAETNFRNQRQKFGIRTDDRRRHVYILGKSGAGKTTLIENMILEDIYAGHGVGFVDPHGDSSEKILNYIPSHRINDVVYFNPSDMEWPVGFNILETVDETHKHLVASGLMGVFKKIWPDVWSPRMEYILNNAVLALLDYPGSTLLGINRLLSDKEYRNKVISQVKDPIVRAFWLNEFAQYQSKFAVEAVAPIQNKVGQFLSASIIRNIVAQVKSTINIRRMMDDGKIFIMNLSKGRIGEDSSRLLGGMLITKIQLAAMERVDMAEKERLDFYLFVDEFQNFATESFAEILSEARKYRLNLILAHQYIAQLDEKVRDAIFGNVGTHILFRVGAADAAAFEEEFAPVFTPEDIVNLANYHIYLKLLIGGSASQPFSANTLPPIGEPTGSMEKVISVSRERYAIKKEVIEEKIERWWGFDEKGEEDGGKGDDRLSAYSLAPRKNFDGASRDDRPPRRDFGDDRAPRRDFDSRPPRRYFDDRSPRDDRPPRPTFSNDTWVSGNDNRPPVAPASGRELQSAPPAPSREVQNKADVAPMSAVAEYKPIAPAVVQSRQAALAVRPMEKAPIASSQTKTPQSDFGAPPKRLASLPVKPFAENKYPPAPCSRCGKMTVPSFKLDASKPFYCFDCLKIVKEKMKMQSAAPRGFQNRNSAFEESVAPEIKTISLSSLIPRPAKESNEKEKITQE
jgi:hypothetical protein